MWNSLLLKHYLLSKISNVNIHDQRLWYVRPSFENRTALWIFRVSAARNFIFISVTPPSHIYKKKSLVKWWVCVANQLSHLCIALSNFICSLLKIISICVMEKKGFWRIPPLRQKPERQDWKGIPVATVAKNYPCPFWVETQMRTCRNENCTKHFSLLWNLNHSSRYRWEGNNQAFFWFNTFILGLTTKFSLSVFIHPQLKPSAISSIHTLPKGELRSCDRKRDVSSLLTF